MRIAMLGGGYPQLLRTLEEDGHRPVYLPEEPGEPAGFPPSMRWMLAARRLRSPAALASYLRCLEGEADAVVTFKGWFGDGERVPPEAAARLRRSGAMTAYWSLDDPFFEEQIGVIRRHAPPSAYDAYLTCCEETRLRAASAGYRAAELLWPAWDSDMDAPDAVPSREAVDVLLIGSVYSGPGWGSLDRPEFVRRAVAAGLRVRVFGDSSWLRAGLPEGVYAGWLPETQNAAENRRAKVVLSSHVRRSRWYLNARTFQAMGAGGGVLLSDVQPGTGEGPAGFLRPGETFEPYAGIYDAVDRAVRLSDPSEAGRLYGVSAAARRAVLAGHTYAHRARELASVLENLAR
jgi:hypothetical protein